MRVFNNKREQDPCPDAELIRAIQKDRDSESGRSAAETCSPGIENGST